VLVTVGLLLSEVLHQSFGVTSELAVSKEGTNVLGRGDTVRVLFADASRTGLRDFRADVGLHLHLHLLAGGLSLTIVSGA